MASRTRTTNFAVLADIAASPVVLDARTVVAVAKTESILRPITFCALFAFAVNAAVAAGSGTATNVGAVKSTPNWTWLVAFQARPVASTCVAAASVYWNGFDVTLLPRRSDSVATAKYEVFVPSKISVMPIEPAVAVRPPVLSGVAHVVAAVVEIGDGVAHTANCASRVALRPAPVPSAIM